MITYEISGDLLFERLSVNLKHARVRVFRLGLHLCSLYCTNITVQGSRPFLWEHISQHGELLGQLYYNGY